MAQIIRILLDNALTHTPDGTKVNVTAVRVGAAELIVGDDGKGLDARALDRVFDRFYSGDSATGSGLGLAIAQELATRMGGSLEVIAARLHGLHPVPAPGAGPPPGAPAGRGCRVRPAPMLAAASRMAALVSGCGGGDDDDNGSGQASTSTSTTEVVVAQSGGDFSPAEIYQRDAPEVVTVLSIFGGGSTVDVGAAAGQGSGFVISDRGEILTNAHVVTTGGENNGGGGNPKPAGQVYVEFSDRNRVPAEIVGFDPDADVALIKVDPGVSTCTRSGSPNATSSRSARPVAASGALRGGESLSVGIISATDRSINSLTQFTVDNAIQTDASINPGNSGGP